MAIKLKQELSQVLKENIVRCRTNGDAVVLQFTSDETAGAPLAVRASAIDMIEVRRVYNKETHEDEELATLRYGGYGYNVRETYRMAMLMWLAALEVKGGAR